MVDRVVRAAGPIGLALVMVRLTIEASKPLSDPDYWWHIRLGHLILEDGTSVGRDGWTTFGTSDWVPTQALTEIVFAKFHDWWGLPGIAWLFGFAVLAVTLVVYALCRQFSEPLVASLVTCLALVGAAGSLSPRPQIVSFILLAVFLMAWLRTEQDFQPRWWLIPLSWLWALSHGMWPLGVTVGLSVAIGLVLSRRATGIAAVKLLSVPLACAAAAGLTPFGWRLFRGPFIVNERTEYISEWARTDFMTPSSWVVAVLILTTIGVWVFRRDQVTLMRALLLLQAVGWLLLSGRTIACAAVIMAPLLAAALNALHVQGEKDRRGWRLERVVLAGTAVVCLVALAFAVPETADLPGRVPTGLDGAIAALPEGTVVFNDDRLGGWLLLEHRNVVPVIDGLFDAYPVEHIDDWASTIGVKHGWESLLDRTGATAALLPEDARLVVALRGLGWTEVDHDRDYTLVVADQQ